MGERGLEVTVETVLDVFFRELLLVGDHDELELYKVG